MIMEANNTKSHSNKMTDKDKADCLIALHNTQMDHFKQTRDIEFKVNLALWVAVVLSGRFLYGKVKLDVFGEWVIFILLSAIIILAHLFLWMMPIQNSEDKDDHFIRQYRSEVEELTGIQLQKQKDKWPPKLWSMIDALRKDGWSWILFEVGITGLLLVGVAVVLSI